MQPSTRMADKGHRETAPAPRFSPFRRAASQLRPGVYGRASWSWGRRAGALQRLSDSELAQRCLEAGGEIQDFVIKRAYWKPRSMLRQLPGAERAYLRSQHLNHDLVTRSFYVRQFSGSVFRLVTELRRRGHVQAKETSVLNQPEDVAAIDRVGGRLVQLGTQLHKGQRKTLGDTA